MLYTYNEEFAAVLLVSTFICFIEFSYLYGLLLLYLFHSLELKVCTRSPVSSLYTFISPSVPSIESAFVKYIPTFVVISSIESSVESAFIKVSFFCVSPSLFSFNTKPFDSPSVPVNASQRTVYKSSFSSLLISL